MMSMSMVQVSSVGIRCPGNEIPKWFSHKSEGCSIKIELPRDWFSTDFLGFALSLVVAAATGPFSLYSKNVFASESFPCDEVFVWCYKNVLEEVVEGAQRPTAFYKLVTEVNVDFTVRNPIKETLIEVEKCGICLLYGKDVEMIKQRAL
ncbi:unnamed protein product [Prunus armeniaca]